MQIIILWSKGRSYESAQAVKAFLEETLPDAKVFLSKDKDEDWYSDLRRQVLQANVGIPCLTMESLGSVWMHFEVGIVAKMTWEDIRPILVDIGNINVDPLRRFDKFATVALDRDRMLELVQALNDKRFLKWVRDDRIERDFNAAWDKFAEKIRRVHNEKPPRKEPEDKSPLPRYHSIAQRVEVGAGRLKQSCAGRFVRQIIWRVKESWIGRSLGKSSAGVQGE